MPPKFAPNTDGLRLRFASADFAAVFLARFGGEFVAPPAAARDKTRALVASRFCLTADIFIAIQNWQTTLKLYHIRN